MQDSTARNAQTDCGADDEPLGIEAFQSFDRMREALLAQVTGGLSPAAVTLAMTDWALHLAAAPGKQAELAYKGWRKAARLQAHMMRAALDPATP
ncbi:poly-beta-hydroxybutyrate polymerase, partial [Candidatus Falkowbacteria bacterium]|nr:poly-beta-hydroxybutyrate polymerase [Candidatus Falkowbacteria bacterium]